MIHDASQPSVTGDRGSLGAVALPAAVVIFCLLGTALELRCPPTPALVQDDTLPADIADRTEAVFDFWQRLGEARPEVHRKAGVESCGTWFAGRWRCGPRDWNFVGRHAATIGGEGRRCIWAHPESKAPLHVVFPALPPESEGFVAIRGGYGLVDGKGDGASVTFEVHVGDERVGRYTIAGKPDGWKTFTARVGESAAPRAPVRFVIETRNNRHRQMCFDAVAVGAGG